MARHTKGIARAAMALAATILAGTASAAGPIGPFLQGHPGAPAIDERPAATPLPVAGKYGYGTYHRGGRLHHWGPPHYGLPRHHRAPRWRGPVRITRPRPCIVRIVRPTPTGRIVRVVNLCR